MSGTNQYNFTWNNAPTGTYFLRAVATDGNGVKSYSYAVKINVTNAPSVNITSPATGGLFSNHSSITFTANAGDFDGYVGKVEFFDGTASLGTATLAQGEKYNFI